MSNENEQGVYSETGGQDRCEPHRENLHSSSQTKGSSQDCDIACAWDDVTSILESFGISQATGRLFSVSDSVSIQNIHIDINNISRKNVVMAFLNRLMSYDYRSIRMFKDFYHSDHQGVGSEMNGTCSGRRKAKLRLSCRDTTYAIINSSDPFLKQIILTKMSACQLAVPVLLPDSERNVSLLLWGLQNIKKAWKDSQKNMVVEETVVNFPFPAVTAIRYGNPGISKSTVLNNMLGPVQENDPHPYFFNRGLDNKFSYISQGTMEALWYLPDVSRSGSFVMNNAICFLNVRGDAEHLVKQVSFASQYSHILLVFVCSSDMVKHENKIRELSKKSTIILVMNDAENLGGNEPNSERFTRMNTVISFDASHLSLLEISENLCTEVNDIISSSTKQYQILANFTPFCKEIGITVDRANLQCSRAREIAEDILSGRENATEYKRLAHPLQTLWQKWTELDRDKGWKGANGNFERELDKLHQSKKEQRIKQRDIGMSSKMKQLYTEMLDPSVTYIQYLVSWLHHILNETSLSSLRPLIEAQKKIREEMRETTTKITEYQRQLRGKSLNDTDTDIIHREIQELKDAESDLQIALKQKTKDIDDSSVGFEHFIREFGQLYECFYEDQIQTTPKSAPEPDVKFLAGIVAKILLTGHPLEIFDGDACHVPVQWIKGVLAAVKTEIGDASIYVISVIGIQSSGKSTLLNSMFGVSFAVSAGRCTRGVFLQLLPVARDAKNSLDIDFVAIIDTEGLKAPEKAISDRKNEDNELATFALCLSDMTLINIGGQTVGEDLSNILQISAHAFIRMKEVNLRSSCYLIQQFVADITALSRNESSTLSILQTLDQAVRTAAIEERKEDQYMQFSDCFNILNLNNSEDDVQYVPSLWRGNMLAPGHEYSKTVLKLKSALLGEIKKHYRNQTLSEFGDRIKSVWEAVKEEDFVFHFRNTNEISQYNKFTLMYQRKKLLLTNEMMKWEMDAQQKIRNSTVENLHTRYEALLTELALKLSTECENIQIYIAELLRGRDYDSVMSHELYFYRDLDCIIKDIEDNIRKNLQLEVAAISDVKAKETQIVPKLLVDLRKQVLPLAEQVKVLLPLTQDNLYSNADITGVSDELITGKFEEEWTRQMTTLSPKHPVERKDNIMTRIECDISRCIIESLNKTGFSKGMKELMRSRRLSDFCEYTSLVESSKDIGKAIQLTGPCNIAMTETLDNLRKTFTSACSDKDFKFSTDFALCLKEALTKLVSTSCEGCGNKQTLLICVCCEIAKVASDANKKNILVKIMKNKKLLGKLAIKGIFSEDEIQQDVMKCVNMLRTHTSFGKDQLAKLLGKFWPPWATDNGRSDDERILSEIRKIFLNYIHSKRDNKWYSHDETKQFIGIVHDVLNTHKLQDYHAKREIEIMKRACNFYTDVAFESEINALEKALPWITVQSILKIESVAICDQMTTFVQALQDVIPTCVVDILVTMSEGDIEKYSRISLSESIRHSIDLIFFQLVPALDRREFEAILTIIGNYRSKYIRQLHGIGMYDAICVRSLIHDLLQELGENKYLGKAEQTVAIAHVCSWAFLFSVEVHCTFVQENSVQALLKKEKHNLLKDFKLLCHGACMDHLAARSVCAVIEHSLKENLRIRVCTSLFQRLSSSCGDVFCSRSRFLQTLLEDLCQKEVFESYTLFLHQHADFIEKWTFNFIVNKCTEATENHVCIKDIVMYEINEQLRKTDESFATTFRELTREKERNSNFSEWINYFKNVFEDTVGTSLDEHRIEDLLRYVNLVDISEFTDQCRNIIRTSTDKALLDDISPPNRKSKHQVRNWISGLPKRIDNLLAKSVQGCGKCCPFCGTFCDDTIKEHEVHFSNLHYPRGVGGGVYKLSGHLICHTCTALVASERGYFSCECGYDVDCGHPTTPYKNYKVHFPGWDIQPIKEYEPTLYWKWVLIRFNKEFSTYYNCKPAEIPWSDITKEEALDSIRRLTS